LHPYFIPKMMVLIQYFLLTWKKIQNLHKNAKYDIKKRIYKIKNPQKIVFIILISISLDVEEVCDIDSLLENEDTYPRMCDCHITSDTKEIVAMYDTGIWWTTIGFALLASLVGLYASIIAGYNGVTKPTQEILRWVL